MNFISIRLLGKSHKPPRQPTHAFMSEIFRSSPYMDFNDGIIFDTPDTLFTNMIHPLSTDDKINLFECRVDVWQLGPAVAILKQIENSQEPSIWSHSAYSLVWILTSYFEMIGKILNPNSKKRGTASADFSAGFRDVYPNYTIVTEDGRTLPDARLHYTWTVLRNGIYHLGYTKSGVVLHNLSEYEDDFSGLLLPKDGNTYTAAFGVNPHKLTRTIVNHLPTFIAHLRDSSETALRDKFEEFVDDFHEPPKAKPIK